MKKVKILAAGDFHGDQQAAQKIADDAKREGVDLIVLNGDIVEEHQPEGIVGKFAGRNVALLPGNHESEATVEFLAQRYKATNLHGYSMALGDVGIFGAGGADSGFTNLTEAELYEALKKGFERVKHLPKKVMVTHIHPADSKIEKFSQFVRGSNVLRRVIDAFKPDVLVCGHVHEAEGIEEVIGTTRVVNVGKKGKIIEL